MSDPWNGASICISDKKQRGTCGLTVSQSVSQPVSQSARQPSQLVPFYCIVRHSPYLLEGEGEEDDDEEGVVIVDCLPSPSRAVHIRACGVRMKVPRQNGSP